jgi:hypothetical protein
MMSIGPGLPSTGPYQQKVPLRRSASSEPWKVAGPDDIGAVAAGQRQHLFGEPAVMIDDHMVGTGLASGGNLVGMRHPADHGPAAQPDDLGQQ